MQFTTLRERLLLRLRAKVRNGQLTERGLARTIGLSQPHIHNVLKGARILSPEVADLILLRLDLSVLDLLKPAELYAYRESKGYGIVQIPFLENSLGPGETWQPGAARTRSFRLDAVMIRNMSDPLVAQTAIDPEMEHVFAPGDFALLDQSIWVRRNPDPANLYLVHSVRGPIVRRALVELRAGAVLLFAGLHACAPCESILLDGRDPAEIIQARVIFLHADVARLA